MQDFSLPLPDGGTVTGRYFIPENTHPGLLATPLVIGMHGGTYNATYFDAYSDTGTEPMAKTLEIPFVSINRPNYRGSTRYPESTTGGDFIIKSGHYIADVVLPAIWEHYGPSSGASSMVLLSHSIGSAVAIVTAASIDQKSAPISGIVLSGIGSSNQPMPEHVKKSIMANMEEAEKTGFVEQDADGKLERMLQLSRGLSNPNPKMNYPESEIHWRAPVDEMKAIRVSW